jgi:FMN reductase (NADPH)
VYWFCGETAIIQRMSINNPVIAQMMAHRSIRAYRPDPIPDGWVEAIVAAGQRAATSSNLQMYSAIAVKQPETRAALAQLCGDQRHIAQAPVFIAWIADLARLDRASVLRGHPHVHDHVENFILATVDVSLMMQNAALAAESLGLGICYIGAIRNNAREIVELLGLPRLTYAVSGMTLGFPAADPMLRPRLPMRAVLHWERYSAEAPDSALAEYDQAMIDSGIYEGRQVPVPGQAGVMEAYGWTEHSARRVRDPQRVTLGGVLRDQGFDFK